MKGASYGLSLIIILLVTNLILYIYGVELPLNTWLGIGVQQAGSGTSYQPYGEQTGNFTSTTGINQIISLMAVVIAGVIVVGITTTAFFGTQWLNWGIPLALIMMFLITFLTPMGNILGTTVDEQGQYCYTMRAGLIMFDTPRSKECVTWEVHVLLAIFFGALIITTFMSFIRGTEW